VAAVAFAIFSTTGSSPPPPVETAVESPAEPVLTGIEFTEIEHEQQKWTLRASQARYFQNEQKSELRDVHLVLHMKTGDEVELQSQRGVLYAGSKSLELLGGVRVTIARSFELTTDYVFYDHVQQRISSESRVHVEGPELLLDGARWEYAIADQRGSVDGDVRARLIFTPRIMSKRLGRAE
jgi:LPS export ABC transporter protein LptC